MSNYRGQPINEKARPIKFSWASEHCDKVGAEEGEESGLISSSAILLSCNSESRVSMGRKQAGPLADLAGRVEGRKTASAQLSYKAVF